MSATFEAAIGIVLKHEGGYVNNPADPGGATNYGVSLRYLKSVGHDLGDINHDGVVDETDIRKMNVGDACTIYKSQWWDRCRYSNFTWQDVATKVFDTAVNMGTVQAHKLLQRSVNNIGHVPLVVDGQLGPATFQMTNSLFPGNLLTEFRGLQFQFYVDLASRNPKLTQFLKGWEIRSKS